MPKRVLIVDDERVILSALRDTLRDEGYEVEAFFDPREAALRLRSASFDCVITDILMAGMSGLDIVRLARELTPDAGLIVITGAPDLASAVEALRLGASDYIVKPVFDKQIERVVVRVIERASLVRQVRQRNAELELIVEASSSLAECTEREAVAEKMRHFEQRAEASGASPSAFVAIANMALEALGRLESGRLERQARLGALLDEQPAGLIYLDESRSPALVSKRARQLLGLPPHPPPGEPDGVPGALLAHIEGLAEAGGVVEIGNPADPGRLLELRVTPVRHLAGGLGTLASLVDVTEQRARESQIHATSRLVMTGHLLGGLCHELNNPLAIILGTADELSEIADNRVTPLADKITSAAERCTALLQKLVQLASPGVGERTRVDLRRQVEAVADLLEDGVRKQGVLLELELADGASIDAVPGEVKDVVLALMLNGLEAMQPDGRLSVRLRLEGTERAVLEIADTGHGMTPQILQRIYDPFFTTKLPARNAGLGMTLVQAACRRMNAELALRSAPGEGSTIRLTFEVARAEV